MQWELRRTPRPPGLNGPRFSTPVLAASVPIYLGAAWLVAWLLPDYSVFAVVPFAWGLHSAVVLFRERWGRGPQR